MFKVTSTFLTNYEIICTWKTCLSKSILLCKSFLRICLIFVYVDFKQKICIFLSFFHLVVLDPFLFKSWYLTIPFSGELIFLFWGIKVRKMVFLKITFKGWLFQKSIRSEKFIELVLSVSATSVSNVKVIVWYSGKNLLIAFIKNIF